MFRLLSRHTFLYNLFDTYRNYWYFYVTRMVTSRISAKLITYIPIEEEISKTEETLERPMESYRWKSQIIKGKQTYNLCLVKITISDSKRKI